MKFKYIKISDLIEDCEKKNIEINTLEELMEFIEEYNEDIIIKKDKETIIIYEEKIFRQIK